MPEVRLANLPDESLSGPVPSMAAAMARQSSVRDQEASSEAVPVILLVRAQ